MERFATLYFYAVTALLLVGVNALALAFAAQSGWAWQPCVSLTVAYWTAWGSLGWYCREPRLTLRVERPALPLRATA